MGEDAPETDLRVSVAASRRSAMAKDAAEIAGGIEARPTRTRPAKGKVAIHEELPELRASHHAIPLAAAAEERRAAG